MRLKKYQVAALLWRTRLKEMVKACLEQISHAGITCNVSTQLTIGLVSAHHHGQCIPTHDGCQALFNLNITRKLRLVVDRNGVSVRRVEIG